MATPCCSEGNCCVFLRGTIYIRAAGGVYRALGNVSQFRLTHENSEYLPLNGELDPSCCEFEAVQAQIVLRCFDNANTLLGFGGAATTTETESVTETLTWTRLDVGSLLPFSSLADTESISAQAGFTVQSYGLLSTECVTTAGQVTVTYTRLKSRTVNAGEACGRTYELMYVGTNSFDGSEVILTIPKIRLRSVSSFDWINQTDAGEMALEGTLLPQATSPVWYNFTRRDCAESCPCSTPVITSTAVLPLQFKWNVPITPFTISATPATSVGLDGNLPTGVTAVTTVSGQTVSVAVSGTPTVNLQFWDIAYTFTNACADADPATATIDLNEGRVGACPVPVITTTGTLPLAFELGVPITPVTITGTPATSATLRGRLFDPTGNLPSGITATTTTVGTGVRVTLSGAPTVGGETWDITYRFDNFCTTQAFSSSDFIDLGEGCVSPRPLLGEVNYDLCTDQSYPRPDSATTPWIRVFSAANVTYTGSLPTGITSLQITSSGGTFDINPVGTPTVAGQTFSITVTATNTVNGCAGSASRTYTVTTEAGCASPPVIGDMSPNANFTFGDSTTKTITIQNVDQLSTSGSNLPDGVQLNQALNGTTVTITLSGMPSTNNEAWNLNVQARQTCGDCLSFAERSFSGVVVNTFEWFSRSSSFIHRAVAYGNGVWVASQAMGTTPTNAAINTSTDGVTWTAPASSTTSEITSEVEFANGLFVHVGEVGRVTTSTDGVTWTQRAQLPGTSPRLRAVHYDNGLWVAVGGSSTQNILTSPDGITWTPRTASTTAIFQDVFFANGRWTAVGDFSNIWTSIDGVNWVSETNPGTVSMSYTAVRYANGLWVTVGSSGAILTSTGGAWTLRTSGTTQQFNDVRYANGTWVAVGNNGIIRTSTDGITWTDGSVGATPLVNWTTVEYADGRWVIGAASAGLIYSSSTAAAGSWVNRTPTGSTGTVYDIHYANGKWVAVGDKISTT